MNPEIEGRPQQKLTRFICQELLYEFLTGRLDLERQTAMDAHLNDCRDSQRELERLKRGLRYTTQAARLQVSDELRAALLGFEPSWQKRLREWTLWSSQRGWKILPYLFVATVIALAVMVTKPWRLIDPSNDIVLTEQTKPSLLEPPPPVAVATAPVADETAVGDEPESELAPIATISALVPPAVAPLTTKVVSQSEPVMAKQGMVRHGSLEAREFTEAWPAIRDKIVALGGKASGNSELGWLKRKDESYFHFSLPESNEQELYVFLKTFGPVRFNKEPDPRVMPEGEIRIILRVKDGGIADEGPTETP